MSSANAQRKSQLIGITVIILAIVIVAVCLSQSKKFVTNKSVQQQIDVGTYTSTNFDQSLWFLPNDNYLGFVEIAAGSFLMGSDPNVDRAAYENERWSQSQKQGRVDLPTYYIGRFEVTAAQFKSFVNDTQYSVRSDLLPNNPESPVVNITWADAINYCRWLEKKLIASQETPSSIKNLLADGWKINLPTEAQWEKAARGVNGNIFPWGNKVTNQFANFSGKGIKPVGSMPCENCAYGLYDMSGNVWELTRSAYLPYPFDENANTNSNEDALFVMRGGSFSDQINNVRAAVRGGVDPGVRNPGIGFRIVLTQH